MKRTHRLYEPLVESALDPGALTDVLRDGRLLAARFEPAQRQGAPFAWLDLVFELDARRALIPLVAIDLAMLVEPEDEAFIWPQIVARRVDEPVLDAIGARLYPWLYAQSVGHALAQESVRQFAGVCVAELARARAIGVHRSQWRGSASEASSVQPRAARFGHPPDAIGGSAGRIALGARRSLLGTPDADTDDVLELERLLTAEGFEVDRVSAGADLTGYDLVHVFGLTCVEESLALLETARELGKPSVLSACPEDVAARGTWGMAATRAAFAATIDERERLGYITHLAAGSLNLPGMKAGERHEPQPGFDADVRRALGLAGVVIVNSAAPYLNTAIEETSSPEPVGEFVLCHAPIEPRANQLMLALAAREAGLPLRLAGPIADARYAELMCESLGRDACLVPEIDPREIRAFYGRARVFADVAWAGTGSHRLARAAAYGCALVVADLRPGLEDWAPALRRVNPASLAELTNGLRDAWHAADAAATRAGAARIASSFTPPASLTATVRAYAQASANLNNRLESAET